MGLKKLIKCCIFWLFAPFVGVRSFVECFEKTKLLVFKWTFGKVLLLVPYLLLLLSFILRGLVSTWYQSDIVSILASYRGEGQSAVVKFDCILTGIVFLEFLIIRLWFLHLSRSSYFESVTSLYESIPPSDQRKAIFLINFFTAYIGLTALPKDLLFYYMQYLRSQSIVETAIIAMATVFLVVYVGYYCSDMVLFYVTSIKAFFVLDDRKNKLLAMAVSCINKDERAFTLFIVKFIEIYHHISRMNRISQILMAINKLIVLPLFSCFTVVAFVETNSLHDHVMKSLLLAIGFFYTIRGYLCTWLFSSIHSDSLKLCRMLHSISVRNCCLPVTCKKYLNRIISELICNKTRFSLQECTNGRITRGDFVFSISHTFQLILLGLGFYFKYIKVESH